MKLIAKVSSISVKKSDISSSMIRVRKIMMRLNKTENSISSLSLCSMHCFQILN